MTTIKNTPTTPENATHAHNAKVNAGLPALPAMPGKGRKASTLRACECGCDGLTARRFVPGHDAKLHGWVLRVERGLLVPNGDVWAQLAWIEENAGPKFAAATLAAIERKYGKLDPPVATEEAATGTEG